MQFQAGLRVPPVNTVLGCVWDGGCEPYLVLPAEMKGMFSWNIFGC